MTITKYLIRKNQYYDSVFLMSINKRLLAENGIIQSAVLMGTQNNKQLLAAIHVQNPEIDQASANDLIVAVIAETTHSAVDALNKLDQFLEKMPDKKGGTALRTLEDGLRAKPNANLAVISVPGEWAAHEAKKALDSGLNVFLFSSNVSVEDELLLKGIAVEKELLVMGPDCGTSIIAGKGLGFANAIQNGPVGVIGPSGTGIQEFACQVHHMGSGISHAIGTGSRDLKDDIGGLTTFSALELLENDPSTQVVAIVSKPAEERTLSRLLKRLENYSKPAVVCFLGVHHQPETRNETVVFAATIDEATEKALVQLGLHPATEYKQFDQEFIHHEAAAFGPGQKYVRGLFAGGTFCYQAQQILLECGLQVHSNQPLHDTSLLPDPELSVGHTLVDMGDEYYTLGKPHPMIDGSLRSQRISYEAQDPETAILLLDFILGFNASGDPVGEAMDAILAAKQKANAENRHLTIIASITGTENDPQDYRLQSRMLKEAGVIVLNSNAAATRLCAAILKVMEHAQ